MRRAELVTNLAFLAPLLAMLAIVCVLTTPLNIVIAGICYACGPWSLFHAKLSLFRQHVWISFGPSRMTPEHRHSYRTGYALIGVGEVVNLVALCMMASGSY